MKRCSSCSSGECFTTLNSRYLQFLAAIGINLGLFSIGMHFGWPSTSIPLLTSGNYTFKITNEEGSWLSSMIAAGTILGCLLGILCLHSLGRKTNILLCIFPLAISWLSIALADSKICMFAGRFLGGMMDGVLWTVVTPYLTEISDSDIRGFLGTTCIVSLALGMLFINVVELFVSMVFAAYIAAAVSLSMLLIVPFLPESPYFLLMKNDIAGAEASLRRLRGNLEVAEELSRMTIGHFESQEGSSKLSDLFVNEQYRKLLLIAWGLNLVQHGCGYLAVQSYCTTIFKESGYAWSPSTANIIYFAVTFLATMVSPLVVDKLGRRPVVILSSALSSVALLGNGTYLYIETFNILDTRSYHFLQLIFILLFSFAHSIGLYTVPTLLISEIFPTNLKTYVLCMASINFGIVSTATILFFNAAFESFGLYVAFWTFGGVLFVGTIFIVLCMPETKRKTLESIQLEMKSFQRRKSHF